MRKIIVPYVLSYCMASTALIFMGNAFAASADYRMLGLAMHQETGRNIYLGAVSVGTDLPNPDNLIAAPAPKVMEYRIVARRTSIRSLLGSMMLQSEVASGKPPGPEVGEFANRLVSSVKGSLYAGDSLEIIQDENGQLQAHLNGIELFRGDDKQIFDYLLMGWIGESGPTSAFRKSILQTDIDSSMQSAYRAHTPSEKRLAVVATWVAPAAAPVAAVAAALPTEEPSTDDAPTQNPVADYTVVAAAAATAEPALGATAVETSMSPSAALDTVTGQAAGEMEALDPESLVKSDNTLETENYADTTGQSEVVAVESGIDLENPTTTLEEPVVDATGMPSDDIQALDVTEYSYRLAGFNTALIRLVYSKIQYPRRAVRREIQGALELDITMLEDGSLVDVAVAESSGHSILDSAAVAAAEKALADTSFGIIDAVAIAEYSNGGNLVIPVPVAFVLQ